MKSVSLSLLIGILAVQAQENPSDLHSDFIYDKSCYYAVCPTGISGKTEILNLKNYGHQISAVGCKKTDSRCQAQAVVSVNGHAVTLRIQYWYRVEAPGRHKMYNTRHAFCHSFAVNTGHWLFSSKQQPCRGGGAPLINPYAHQYDQGSPGDDTDPGYGGGGAGMPGGGGGLPGGGP